MRKYILAIDQGTTNSRAIIFDESGALIGHHERALTQSFPHDGWVEQDPVEMFNNTVECCRMVLKKSGLSAQLIAAIGITNQRETTILWDKKTGEPIYPAIVWQDRRTSDDCKLFASHPIAAHLQHKTGLLLDPYFSATKISWILNHVPDARARAEQGDILFGTVDTWLLWKLTGGKSYFTDVTNASRTLLFNIRTLEWDKDILTALQIPVCMLPDVRDNAFHYGLTEPDLFGVPLMVGGMAGDQQAAAIGQACFQSGMMKATFGTGCFVLLNTGDQIIESRARLLSTIAYRINGRVTYALEGSIFCAGTTIKWLRDQLHLIKTAAETELLASQVADTCGVYLVPAFTGLGAPYWDPEARGAITGLTRKANREHVVRAALESVAYQTKDLLEAMQVDYTGKLAVMRVDGGMAANNFLLQFLASMLGRPVERPVCIETTALGAAYLAGLQAGVYASLADITRLWQLNDRFEPEYPDQKSMALYQGWLAAVDRVKS